MNNQQKMKRLNEMLDEIGTYERVIGKLNFDLECVCPRNGMEQANKDMAYLSQFPFNIEHSEEFVNLVKELHENHEGLTDVEVKCVEQRYRSYCNNKNITADLAMEERVAIGDAYVAWLTAKETGNYETFRPKFQKVIDVIKKVYSLRDEQKETLYDTVLNDYEPGLSIARLDDFFGKVKEGLVPLVKKIQEKGIQPRRDFLFRYVPVAEQEAFSKWLLTHEGQNMDSLALLTTEHPFTSGFGLGDVRIATHYHENSFVSNIFTTMHEGGHALFDQNEPKEFYKAHVFNHMTAAMHECMSRLFENYIARSEAFMDLMYPQIEKTFGDKFSDVSKEEFYKAINIAEPTLIRTEADELTYPLHILIRYEMEKGFINGEYDTVGLNEKWKELYTQYLGVTPSNDTEGILQDVHWSYMYGYFPGYALGSAYAAQIMHRMKQDIDVDKEVRNDNIAAVREWLKEHAWNIASVEDPDEWIKDVTGEAFNPQYYIDYLTEKYTKLYNLK